MHAVDVAFVAFLIYRLLMLVRGTRAWRILVGVLIFVFALYLSDVAGLNTLHWILDKATLLGPVALVILLLPELRQAIEGMGRLGLWPQRLAASAAEERLEAHTVEEIVTAVSKLAASHTGALIVVEKGAPLSEIAASGVRLDADVSAALLETIFYENNPLHDGAVVIRGDTLLAAACRLPLSESSRLDPVLHMRHRAAVGVTEALDCLSIVVSEERGTISVAQEGRLRRQASAKDLRQLLHRELRGVTEDGDLPERPRRQRKGVEAGR